jgi:hypothetical protein
VNIVKRPAIESGWKSLIKGAGQSEPAQRHALRKIERSISKPGRAKFPPAQLT